MSDAQPPHRDRSWPFFWTLCSALSFSTMGTLSHALRDVCDWKLIVFVRTVLMLVFAVGLGLVKGVRFRFFRPATLWIRSLAGCIALLCTFYAFTHLPVSEASTLINLQPIGVALLSWPVLGERPRPSVWFAVALSIVGVVLITQPHFETGGLPVVVGLTSSVFASIAMLGLHKLKDLDSSVVVIHFSVVATVVTGGYYLMDRVPTHIDEIGATAFIGLLIGVGIAGTSAQLTLTLAYARGNPSHVAVVALTQLIFSAIYDRIVWNRHFNVVTILGMLLVLAPTVWLIHARAMAAARRKSEARDARA